MVRRAAGMKTSTPKGHRGGSSPAAPQTTAKATAAKKTAAAAKQPSATSARAISKDELRVQVERLERANATLRVRSREANRTAKLAASRIAELEEEVAGLQKRVSRQTATAERTRRSATIPDSEPQSQGIDPAQVVPSGVAPEEPDPMEQEA